MRRIVSPRITAIVASLFCIAASASGAVQLNGLFTDNMVLQQDKKIAVWGTADDGEKVTVSLGDQQASAEAKEGRWIVWLNPMKAGGPIEMKVNGSNTITLKNVLVGEVWICSGQSNMAWPVSASTDKDKYIAESKNPQIRLYKVPNITSTKPLADVKGSWVECNPQTVPSFSAVGYFFGKDLNASLKVPVGLINTSWGGTPAESWTSREALEANPALKNMLPNWERYIRDEYPKAQKAYEEKLKKWREQTGEKKPKGKKGAEPRPPAGPNAPHRPSCLYNAMIHPLLPFAIRGAIWYQGESNASRAFEYRTLFATMIQDWRKVWNQGDFAFLCVQLAPFENGKEQCWPELREAQFLATQTLPNVGMAVITDLGNRSDIHPKQKAPVGARLALAARAIAYGEKIVYSGPIYSNMKVEGGKVVLSFKHVGGGLVAKDGELKGFTIAGKDQKFVPAKAEISGEQVVVGSPEVTEPVAVRYGWLNCPEVNLFNKEGLPASPFRTDDFPMITRK